MCTVSWLHTDGGYHLLCNRDEQRSRPVADAPTVREQRGVQVLAPTDGALGGTWISVNEYKVTLCLLNAVAPSAAARGAQSRGWLLASLAPGRRVDEVVEQFSGRELTSFAPFSLLALEPGSPAALMEWDGQRQRVCPAADACSPLVSSSFDLPGVKERRRREFHRLVRQAPGEALSAHFAFHASHGAQPDAYSPCMHRPDAETVSFSWIHVSKSSAGFFYAPGPVCQWRPGRTYELRFPN
jgi:hypothetical protein